MTQIEELVTKLKQSIIVATLPLALIDKSNAGYLMQQMGMDVGSTSHFGKRDGGYSPNIEIWPAWQKYFNDPAYVVEFINNLFAGHTLVIYDMAKQNGLLCQCDLCAFLVRLRHSLAHNGRWHAPDSAKHKAGTFRNFELGPEYWGEPALRNEYVGSTDKSMMPGDVLELWDELLLHWQSHFAISGT